MAQTQILIQNFCSVRLESLHNMVLCHVDLTLLSERFFEIEQELRGDMPL